MSPVSRQARVCVVAAGGTGGHMFPAEALSRELSARGWRIVLAQLIPAPPPPPAPPAAPAAPTPPPAGG